MDEDQALFEKLAFPLGEQKKGEEMERFLQYTMSGLSTGAVYALVALGLVLIYRSTRILNFAHGDVTTAGTFVAFTLLAFNVPFIVAAVLALLFGAVLAMASGPGNSS